MALPRARAAPGTSNRRDKKSVRRAQEQAAPYHSGKGGYNARVVADEDDFPHPPTPDLGDAREQADYNARKHQWCPPTVVDYRTQAPFKGRYPINRRRLESVP